MNTIRDFLKPIRSLHEQIRDAIVSQCESSSLEAMSGVAQEAEGDTIYAVDRVSEDLLVDFFEREVAPESAVVLIAEGLSGGEIILPRGSNKADAQWRVIVDPIDGTRGLMYQKRSAWVLTGIAPNRGAKTGLQDIELAVQTEVPLVKQHLSDSLWAIRGQGCFGERYNRITGARAPLRLRPSGAHGIRHGFAMIARFFPGARDVLAAIDEEVTLAALGPVQEGKASCFEDQYISTGGQLYELMAGHDRFVADLRPLLSRLFEQRGDALGLCCHPYDLCTALIAEEAGVIMTDPWGKTIDAPLSVDPNVAWVGYANIDIRTEIEPILRKALHRRNLL